LIHKTYLEVLASSTTNNKFIKFYLGSYTFSFIQKLHESHQTYYKESIWILS